MGDTKIFVVQLKEVVKSALYVILGLALIGLLVYFFIPKKAEVENKGSAKALYVPGTYSIELMLSKTPVNVLVSVTENEIVSVKLDDLQDTQQTFYPLLEPTMDTLSSEIVKSQTSEIPTTSEYTVTNQVLLEAVKIALMNAEAPVR